MGRKRVFLLEACAAISLCGHMFLLGPINADLRLLLVFSSLAVRACNSPKSTHAPPLKSGASNARDEGVGSDRQRRREKSSLSELHAMSLKERPFNCLEGQRQLKCARPLFAQGRRLAGYEVHMGWGARGHRSLQRAS